MPVIKSCESVEYLRRVFTLKEVDLIREYHNSLNPPDPAQNILHQRQLAWLRDGEDRAPAYGLVDGREGVYVSPKILHRALNELYNPRIGASESKMTRSGKGSDAPMHLFLGYEFPDVLDEVTNPEFTQLESNWYFPSLVDPEVGIGLRLSFEGHLWRSPAWWLTTISGIGLADIYNASSVNIHRRSLDRLCA